MMRAHTVGYQHAARRRNAFVAVGLGTGGGVAYARAQRRCDMPLCYVSSLNHKRRACVARGRVSS